MECDYWQFKCQSDGICIDSRRRCDRNLDCEDGTDEEGCFEDNDNDDEDDDAEEAYDEDNDYDYDPEESVEEGSLIDHESMSKHCN